MDCAFVQDRITAVKAQIIAYETAILALTTGGIASYTLNTGQTTQTVTKLDIEKMDKAVDSLMNRLATLEARCGKGSTSIGRPL